MKEEEEQEEAEERAAPELEQPAAEGTVFPIVGIGASAGGIEALKHFFAHTKPGTGIGFIVVQHLDPEHESVLPEILSRVTALGVEAIEDETDVERDHVYVVPPNASATIHEGRLLLARPVAPRGQRTPIDELLVSLAYDRGENAACVILSGTGSDGTLGLRAIKDSGGLTLAQARAEYDGMMRSAVSTGLVDFVMPAEEIPAKLTDYFAHLTRTARQEAAEKVGAEAVDHLHQITTLLRVHTGHDFSDYKDRTIIRRVQRRMHVLQIDDVDEFIKRLRRDNREVRLLFHDLLIGVTSFFRDKESFEALEREVIPQLFSNKGATDSVRVWVPGCATGEEAYSIAMLLREHAPAPHRAPRLQIFASDIDEHALEVARTGRYPVAVTKDISAARLERYFVHEEGTCRVVSELREICLFSAHNMLRDAPFSKLDLISCRNLLIYLSAELQERVIPLFHYALNQNGWLFLGSSENIKRHSRLFATVDKTHRIFRRRTGPERQVPKFPLSMPSPLEHREQSLSPGPRAIEPNLRTAAERQLLDQFAPAYVVVNTEGDVMQASSRTGKYLELPAGAPDVNVLNMARSGLRLDLRTALHRATTSGQPVTRSRVVVGTNGGRQEIILTIQPLRYGKSPDAPYLIVFQEVGEIHPSREAEPTPSEEDLEDASVRQLEAELRTTKERLQTTTEELESSNEELKSSNEELQSINEELQSTNEELETSKEELQSINEELQTVNSELNARVEELSRANNDINNLLESTQIATLFLDRNLLVKGFTPAAKDVFRLVESDTGRPITHVRARFTLDTLHEDAERVLRTLTPIEKPVRSIENDTRYMMRMHAYRTADNVINGVVITFTDVTRVTLAEERIAKLAHDLNARVGELRALLDLISIGVMIAEDGDARNVVINRYGAELMGEKSESGLLAIPAGLRLFEGDRELAQGDQPWQRALSTGKPVVGWQGRLVATSGQGTYVMISATPLFGENKKLRGAIAAIVDISAHKLAEDQQDFLLHELQHRVKNILATVAALASRMARQTQTAAEFRDAFLSRLNAMARTHELLSADAWRGAGLRELVKAALAPYQDGADENLRLRGEDIRLVPNAATTMGMVFHELATNAAKYGAFSTRKGKVNVAWERVGRDDEQGGEQLAVTWTEEGGPKVDPSAHAGFGTGFISRSVEYELRGSAKLELRPEGVHCSFTIPFVGNAERAQRT